MCGEAKDIGKRLNSQYAVASRYVNSREIYLASQSNIISKYSRRLQVGERKGNFCSDGGAAEQAAAPWRLPPRLSLVLKDEAVASGAVFVPLQDKLINK